MNLGPDLAVHDQLKSFFADLTTDDDAWPLMFPGVATDKVEYMRDAFRALGPTVVLGFPRGENPWPVVAVILMPDSPEQEFVGRGQINVQAAAADNTLQFGMAVNQQVGVIIVGENSESNRILSIVAKAGIMAGHTFFAENALPGYSYGGQGDLAPDQTYLPEHLWVRQQTWSFLFMDEVLVGTSGDKIRGPVYCGVEGTDLGNGFTGKVEPTT